MSLYLDDGDVQFYHGDAITVLQSLPSGIAQTCVTSPPYWGLRDYGTGTWTGGDEACDHKPPPRQPRSDRPDAHGFGTRSVLAAQDEGSTTYRDVCGKCGAQRVDDQLGLEATPTQYVERLVRVFREVRRVLRDDGTLWLNLGDSYNANQGAGANAHEYTRPHLSGEGVGQKRIDQANRNTTRKRPDGLKPKDLVGIPWSVAKAMQQPYYTGRIAAERDRVWLAATLDAEGSICGFHHTRADDGSTLTGIHVTITNSSLILLDEAHRIWPTSRADHNPHGNGHLGKREMRRWIAHNVDDKALLLRELYPYLIAKRQQALLAWNFLEMSKVSKRIGKLAEGREAKARRSWIVHALSALNRGDGVDLPNWIVEPPSLFEPGWYLRSDIIWAKPNPMPESVTDRPTKAHEYLFLFSKQPRYFYDADAIREAHDAASVARAQNPRNGEIGVGKRAEEFQNYSAAFGDYHLNPAGRNRRSVWTIPTEPFPEAHFATYPQELVRPCIQAGTSERGGCALCGAPWKRQTSTEYENPGNRTTNGDRSLDRRHETAGFAVRLEKRTEATGWRSSCECTFALEAPDASKVSPQLVLDPFVGSGTTALVARKHGRRCIGIDLSLEYLAIAAERTRQLSLLGGAP